MCDSNQRKFKQDDELVTKMAQGSKQNALFVTQTDPARGLGGEVGWKFDNKTHKDVLKQQYLEEVQRLFDQIKSEAEQYHLEGLLKVKQVNDSKVLDPNFSVVDHIEAKDVLNFQDSACWILLTSPKPASHIVFENSKLQKELAKDGKWNPKQGSAQTATDLSCKVFNSHAKLVESQKEQGTAKKQDEDSQRVIQASFIGGVTATSKQSQIARQDGRGHSVRASTIDKVPGSTNMNYLIQQTQNQLVLPQKRYGHTSTIIDNKLYIFGGSKKKGGGQQTFHSFYECTLRLESQRDDIYRWKKIQGEAPPTRDSHSCVSFHGQLLIFGGGGSDKCFNDLYKYNVKEKVWMKLEPLADPGQAPRPREGHIALLVNEGDKMLVHGGIGQDLECYDDAFILVGLHAEIDQVQSEIKRNEKGEITNIEELKSHRGRREMLRWFRCRQEGTKPSARDSHSATMANNQIYIFGGQDNLENQQNDLYRAYVRQDIIKKTIIGRDGQNVQISDRAFTIVWARIDLDMKKPGMPWPGPRSSHTTNLYLNRFIVLIGGEQKLEECEKKNSVANKEKDEHDKNSEDSDGGEDSQSKSLNDIWLYDVILEEWLELNPPVKVQPTFNNKKLRKSFEPRMAHSANLVGNYIVIFGGYNAQTKQYTPPNFNLLSLTGCSDFMLEKANTMAMVYQLHFEGRMLKQEQQRKSKDLNDKKSVKKDKSKQQSNMKIVLDNIGAVVPSSTKKKHKKPNGSTNIIIDTSETSMEKDLDKKQNTSSKITIDAGFGFERLHDSDKKQFSSENKVVVELPSDERRTVDFDQYKRLELQLRQSQNRINYKMAFEMSLRVKSPMQLLCSFISGLISQQQNFYSQNEPNEPRKVLHNPEQFQKLNIKVSLSFAEKNCKYIRIDDNGPGLSSTNLREALAGVSPQFKLANQDEQERNHDRFQPIMYAALRLCQTCLIITKVLKKKIRTNHSGPSEFQEEVHVGMLSNHFLRDTRSKFISVPITSFKVEKKQDVDFNSPEAEQANAFELYDLVPLTLMADQFINLMLSYTKIFDNVADLKNFVLNNLRPSPNQIETKTGTMIFLYGVMEPFEKIDADIVLQDFDYQGIEHSLSYQLRSTFIERPQNTVIEIEEQEVDLESPFDKLMNRIDPDFVIRYVDKFERFQFWLISERLITHFCEVDRSILEQLEGILVFRNNNFVCKLTGLEDYFGLPRGLGKRSKEDASEKHDLVRDRVHGIVIVQYGWKLHELTFDHQDFVNQDVHEIVKEDIVNQYTLMINKIRARNPSFFDNFEGADEEEEEIENYKQLQKRQRLAENYEQMREMGSMYEPLEQIESFIPQEQYHQLSEGEKEAYFQQITKHQPINQYKNLLNRSSPYYPSNQGFYQMDQANKFMMMQGGRGFNQMEIPDYERIIGGAQQAGKPLSFSAPPAGWPTSQNIRMMQQQEYLNRYAAGDKNPQMADFMKQRDVYGLSGGNKKK